jgi:hypothetical protein
LDGVGELTGELSLGRVVGAGVDGVRDRRRQPPERDDRHGE